VSTLSHLVIIARRFALDGDVTAVEPLSGGHINESYRVQAGTVFLLQRVNPEVFPDSVAVMENIAWVTSHLASRLRGAAAAGRTVLTLVPTSDGAGWVQDAAGAVWRMYRFVTGAHMIERVTTAAEARQGALAFGEFAALLADYGGPRLHETIRGFHDTAARLHALERAAAADTAGRHARCGPELAACLAARDLAGVLPPLMAGGEVPLRIAHNDAKIANVLFDDADGRARCVVDLDTVMPGSLLHDFGDIVRSMTSPTAEDAAPPDEVFVREELFEAVVEGYLEGAGGILTPRERELLVFAGRLITLEQAARFLTDYLDGDRYYRDTRGDQNLRRTRTQLALYRSLTEQAGVLEKIAGR
jgi:Ser/Thr protein kinase RdoA (MazF antagonist)